MYQIPYLSVARFSGEEAGAFLQAQLSADIEALLPGESSFACYCTPKGQVLGLLLVQREGEAFAVAAASSLLDDILKRLRMFVFRTRVVFEPCPDICVHGEPGPTYVFAARQSQTDGGENAWKAEELRNGICWLGEATREKYIPQMLGFDELGAVSFSKGCYPGQEIVARARYLGKVKRKPLLLHIEGEPDVEAGERIEVQRGDGPETVSVVDSAQPEKGRTLLFCVARDRPDIAVRHVVIRDLRYGCATM